VGGLQAVGGAGVYTGSGAAQPPPPPSPPPPTSAATLRPVSAVELCEQECYGYDSVSSSFCVA